MRGPWVVVGASTGGFAALAVATAAAAAVQRRHEVAAEMPGLRAAEQAFVDEARRRHLTVGSEPTDWLGPFLSPADAPGTFALTVAATALAFAAISLLVVVLARSGRPAVAVLAAGAASAGIVVGVGPLALLAPPLVTGTVTDPGSGLRWPHDVVPLWWSLALAGITLAMFGVQIVAHRAPAEVDAGRPPRAVWLVCAGLVAVVTVVVAEPPALIADNHAFEVFRSAAMLAVAGALAVAALVAGAQAPGRRGASRVLGLTGVAVVAMVVLTVVDRVDGGTIAFGWEGALDGETPWLGTAPLAIVVLGGALAGWLVATLPARNARSLRTS